MPVNQAVVGPRNHVRRHELAHLLGGRGAGIHGGLHARHVAAHDDGDIPAANLAGPFQCHVSRLAHCVGRLHEADHALGLDESECQHHVCLSVRASAPRDRRAALLRAETRQHLRQVVVRPRDHLHADHFAQLACRLRARVGRGLDRRHVAFDKRGHQAGAHRLPRRELDRGRLQHRVHGLEEGHQPPRLHHPQRQFHRSPLPT